MEEALKDDWIDTRAAAEQKGVTRQAVAFAIKEGRLKAVQMGRFWLVSRRELDDWQPVRGRGRKKETSDE